MKGNSTGLCCGVATTRAGGFDGVRDPLTGDGSGSGSSSGNDSGGGGYGTGGGRLARGDGDDGDGEGHGPVTSGGGGGGRVQAFLKDENGADLAEYALVLVLIAIVAIAAFFFAGGMH